MGNLHTSLYKETASIVHNTTRDTTQVFNQACADGSLDTVNNLINNVQDLSQCWTIAVAMDFKEVLLSGAFWIGSSNRLTGIQKNIVNILNYDTTIENGVLLDADGDEETVENLLAKISPFGDMKLVITKSLDLIKPVYINYNGNYKFHNVSNTRKEEKNGMLLVVE